MSGGVAPFPIERNPIKSYLRFIALGAASSIGTLAPLSPAHAASTARIGRITTVETIGGMTVLYNGEAVQATTTAGAVVAVCEVVAASPAYSGQNQTWCDIQDVSTGIYGGAQSFESPTPVGVSVGEELTLVERTYRLCMHTILNGVTGPTRCTPID